MDLTGRLKLKCRGQLDILYTRYIKGKSESTCLNELGSGFGYFTENKKNDPQSSILVIVPFRDKWDLTKVCLDSMINQNLEGINLDVVLANNQSKEASTLEGIDTIIANSNGSIRFHHFKVDTPFNFSKINNMAVSQYLEIEKHDKILLLNNDIELVNSQTLRMLSNGIDSMESLSAVGCTLVYRDETIQHLFLNPGCKIVGSHPGKGRRISDVRDWIDRNHLVPGVTGALLLTNAQDFIDVGGLDECLATCYQDLDYCLKLSKIGKDIGVVSSVQAIHDETQSRSPTVDWQEVAYINNKWGIELSRHLMIPDHFSRFSEPLCETKFKSIYPWQDLVPKR